MRVLVVGSYPPPAHGEAHRTVATVHRLGAQGDDVEVLSRRGSAAQLRGPIAGPVGALLAWWRGRRYDAVVVQVESGAPLRRLPRPPGPRRPPRRLPRVGPGAARRAATSRSSCPTPTSSPARSAAGAAASSGPRPTICSSRSERGRRRLVDEGGAAEDRVELPDARADAEPAEPTTAGTT